MRTRAFVILLTLCLFLFNSKGESHADETVTVPNNSEYILDTEAEVEPGDSCKSPSFWAISTIGISGLPPTATVTNIQITGVVDTGNANPQIAYEVELSSQMGTNVTIYYDDPFSSWWVEDELFPGYYDLNIPLLSINAFNDEPANQAWYLKLRELCNNNYRGERIAGWTLILTYDSGIPAPPTIGYAEPGPNGYDVEVHWNRSPDPDVVGYKIYAGTSPSPSLLTERGTVDQYQTSAVINSLTAGTLYYFAVSAINTYGTESPLSGMVSATPNFPPPAAPTWLTATTTASNQVTLNWDESSGPDPAGYAVFYGTTKGNYTHYEDAGNVRPLTISGLDHNTLYYFAVKTYNHSGVLSETYTTAEAFTEAVPDETQLEETQQGNNGDCASFVSNPIKITNGNKFESRQDLVFTTPNRDKLTFSRYYNSRSDQAGGLGHGWSHNYSVTLSDDTTHDSAAVPLKKITDPTGKGVYFEDTAVGQWDGVFSEKTYVLEEDGGYTWYRLDGSRYHFMSTGQLEWLEDTIGNRQTLSYSGGFLQSVTDQASGRSITFHYYPSGLLEYISGPVTPAVADGKWVTYGYDTTNTNLTSVTYADGSGVDYQYDAPGSANNLTPDDPHNLTAKLDKMGHELATWKYDDQDRAYHSTTWDGKGVDIDYVDENTVKVTDAYGVERTYTIDEVHFFPKVTNIAGPGGCQSCTGEAPIRYEYDDSLNVTLKEYANGTINKYFDFDERGNPGTVILAFGTSEQRTINYTYHPELNTPLTRKELSTLATTGNDIYKETIWDYDDDDGDYDGTPNESPTRLVSHIIEMGYTRDSNGNIVLHESQITFFSYNSKGQVESIDGPLPGSQDVTTYEYDPVTGDLLTVTPPLPLNVATTFVAAGDFDAAGNPGYDEAGNPQTMIDINNQTTTYTYDGRNRLLTSTINGIQTARSFNDAGDLETETDSGNRVLTYTYDQIYGRLERITDMDGNYLYYSYDDQGNRTVDSAYDAAGVIQRWQGFDYQNPNDPGKLWKVFNHNEAAGITYNTETKLENNYTANTKTVIDERLRTTVYQYDPLKRLARTIQPGNRHTDYGYDSQGHPTSVMDAIGKSTAYEYDDLGRILSETSPDTGVTTYTYDLLNNTKSITYNDNVTVIYSYDALGRLTGMTFPDPTLNITYIYDEDKGVNGKGRLTTVMDASGITDYVYNSLGQLEQESRTIDVINTFTTGYGYNPLTADLESITYPSSLVVSYQRDNNGRISQILANGQPVIKDITYKPFGPVEDYVLGNNILTVDRTYNDRYLLKKIATTTATMDYDYQYYDDGSVWKIAGLPSTSTVSNGTTQTFLIPGTNKIHYSKGYGTQLNGYRNIFENTSISYAYNQDGRLKEVESISAIKNVLAEYSYDASGRRVKKTVNGVVTVFHYDINNNLISETDELGLPIRDYIYLDNQPVAMIVYGANAGTYYFINDHLGTPQQLVDDFGMIVWQVSYLPFGEAQILVETVTNNLRFPGQYYDEESGLHYNWNRYYDPQTGRYISPDPIGLKGGINLYGYVQNNPVNWIDPRGLWGTFTIKSHSGGESSLAFGHSWIEYEWENLGSKVTYGTFGNHNGAQHVIGLNRDSELNSTYTASRSTLINDAQEAKLLGIINEHKKEGEDAWGYLAPCSDFASDTWEDVTGEPVRDRNLWGVSTPGTLSKSLNKLKGKPLGKKPLGGDWYSEN